MLSEKIATLRKSKKLSQEELADILFTSRQAVSKWERGESYPDIDRLKDLAIYFNVSIDYLLDYDIEAVSLNGFMERLAKCAEARKFDVSIDEIKMVVSKNKNNFDLLIRAIEYLIDYWAENKTIDLIELVTSYCKRAITIFQPNNKAGVTIKDLHSVIGESFMVKGDYAATRAYFKENKISGFETLEAHCDVQLGNYKEAQELLSGNYLQSFTKLIDGNIAQIILFLKTKKYSEAYDLSNWTIDFIKSAGKNETFYLDVRFMIMFMRAACERALKLDDSETLEFLKAHKDVVESGNENSDNMKFYYGKQVTFVSLVTNVKESIYKEMYKQGDEEAKLGIDLYKEVFGEE